MHIPVTVHEPFGYYPGRSPRSLAMHTHTHTHTHAHTHTHTHTSVRLLRPKQMQSCNLCTCFPRQHFLLGTNHTGPFCPYAPTPPRFFGTYSMMAAKSAANGARNLRHSDRSVRMELTKGPLSAKCIHTHTHTRTYIRRRRLGPDPKARWPARCTLQPSQTSFRSTAVVRASVGPWQGNVNPSSHAQPASLL